MCFLFSLLLWILHAIHWKRCVSFGNDNELWVRTRQQPHRIIRSSCIRYRTPSTLLDSSRQEEVGKAKKQRAAEHRKRIKKIKINDEGNDNDDTTTTLSGKGISVDDWLSSNQKVKAKTKFTILQHPKPSTEIGFIQVEQGDLPINRYIIPLPSSVHTDDQQNQQQDFYMIDVPPFSPKLVQEIRLFLKQQTKHEEQEQQQQSSQRQEPTLKAILITCKTSIHYNEAPGTVYTMRKSDVPLWKEAFPGVKIIMHRNDMEKDLQGSIITQVLDGYGPWAWNETTGTLEETGHKLVVLNWDTDKIMRLYSSSTEDNNATEMALREAGIDPNQVINIRAKEANRKILAVYTPGHTMGSMCYVLPPLGVCFSGHTIPEHQFRDTVRFDGFGTVSTNKAGLTRQVNSALQFAETYVDRFHTIFPSRGKVIHLPIEDQEQRRSTLKLAIKQFGKVAKAYSDLGIL